MKKILALILIMFSIVGYSQNKDTIYTKDGNIIRNNIKSIDMKTIEWRQYDDNEGYSIKTDNVKYIKLSQQNNKAYVFDSTLSIKDNLINIKSDPKEIVNSMYMHHREFKSGLKYSIIGGLIATSSVVLYVNSIPRYFINSNSIKKVSYITGAIGGIVSTVGVIMIIDSDKWFDFRIKL